MTKSGVLRFTVALVLVVMLLTTLYSYAGSNEREDDAMDEKIILQYPVFDGERIWEDATVVIENGIISDETILSDGDGESESDYFLMPGLIDAHTHMGKENQVEAMLINGITATCDVSVSDYSMALGNISDGKAYVENAVNYNADYIKVILEEPTVISWIVTIKLQSVLNDIDEETVRK